MQTVHWSLEIALARYIHLSLPISELQMGTPTAHTPDAGIEPRAWMPALSPSLFVILWMCTGLPHHT